MRICKALAASPVTVLEDAENLPLGKEESDYGFLMRFLAVFANLESSNAPKLILVSPWRGHLSFSGSHLHDTVEIPPLSEPETVQLLQEAIAIRPLKYSAPSATEVEHLARRTFGFPLLVELLADLLADYAVDDVLSTFHERDHVRRFVANKILRRTRFTASEIRVLHFLSLVRVPVHSRAMARVFGASVRALLAELADRRLITEQADRISLHPLIVAYFRADAEGLEGAKSLHRAAAQYFAEEQSRQTRNIDAQIEHVYHAMRAGVGVELAALQKSFVAPLRTLILEGVSNRDWEGVVNAADRLLQVMPDDTVGKISKSIALDATGSGDADAFFESVKDLDRSTLWLATEFAKSKIRRRDLGRAELILEELGHKHGHDARVQVAWAQLHEKRGEVAEAIERCRTVLSSEPRPWDAFTAGLVLRHLGELEVFVEEVDRRRYLLENGNVHRLYAYGCVITEADPEAGLEILSEQWQSDRSSGFRTADYAGALAFVGRTSQARTVFRDGIKRCSGDKRGLPSLKYEYAMFLSGAEAFSDAHAQFRDLLRMRRHDLHVYRSFAKSLHEAAASYSRSGNRQAEDACLQEADDVLQQLLELAPRDEWAERLLHKVSNRIYA